MGDRANGGTKRRTSTTVGIIILAVVLVAAAIVVVVVIRGGDKPVAYSLNDTSFVISSQFGETIALSDITGVQMQDIMPDNLQKTIGFNNGSILRGNFRSGDEQMKVYVNTSIPPFLYIETKEGLVIVNDQSADKTQALFQELQDKIAS